MEAAAAALLPVLRKAARRYRMPPLPVDAQAARAAGPATAIAFAMEAARALPQRAGEDGLRALFTDALASLIHEALDAQGGDPNFQAQVLRSADAQVEAYARLASHVARDRRAVRAAADALAHPGKLAALEDASLRGALAQLHAASVAQDWDALQALAASAPSAQALATHPALARLRQLQVLQEMPAVQRYLALCARRGPLAGTDEATAHGRASSQVGAAAEDLVAQALLQAAAWLDRREPDARPHRVVRGLRTPAGFPEGPPKAKDEWDAAIVRTRGSAADVVLLAEVKASPAAATPDFGRLLRGLQRLAGAEADAVYPFPCTGDEAVALHGASLRALAPPASGLPPQVVYCCAAQEVQPAMLSAATRAVLLGEAASLAFARDVLAGAQPPADRLAPVWTALQAQARLRSALHQYDTARAAREAMLHPADLLAALGTREASGE